MGAKPGCPAPSCCGTVPEGHCCDEVPEHRHITVHGINVLDWGPDSVPVGKVLGETLGHLDTLDRQLLLFSATSNLAAVRWLLYLGAQWDCCDANGSTCLHVACRAGGISIVMEHMRHRALIETVDVAGWRPLHIAAHMGRREVVVRLLAARANPRSRDAMGNTPEEICLDQGTKQAFLMAHLAEEGVPCGREPSAGLLSQMPQSDSVGIPIECEPEVFFVTPEPAILDTASFRAKLVQLAVRIFNLQPSYGLAFLVASGLTESYTAAMKLILKSEEASQARVGTFLGATLSLCPLIRFGLFDSMALMHTGVVSALVLAFSCMQLPEDRQMIDRLVRGLAVVWWRKHRTELLRSCMGLQPEASTGPGELVGFELLQYLGSSDVLWQLMFSVVLLHSFIHGDGKRKKRVLPEKAWLALNRGIENGGTDVPDHVQFRIHRIVGCKFIPQLRLVRPAEANSRSQGANDAPAAAEARNGEHQAEARLASGCKAQTPAVSSALTSAAIIEGWVRVLGGHLPHPSSKWDVHAWMPEASCCFEDGGSDYSLTNDQDIPEMLNMSGALAEEFLWASLCYVLLFFSIRPAQDAAGAPYAVVDARKIRILEVDPETLTVRFVGCSVQEGTGELEQQTAAGQVSLILLLPDGRWRAKHVSKLELRFLTSEEMHLWVATLIHGPLSQHSQML